MIDTQGELTDLRSELQKIYEKQEKCLVSCLLYRITKMNYLPNHIYNYVFSKYFKGKLPELWETHFPELHLLYPDLELNTSMV